MPKLSSKKSWNFPCSGCHLTRAVTWLLRHVAGLDVLFSFFSSMFNINNIKVSHLPKAVKFFNSTDGHFEINEDWEIRMFAKRDCDELKLSELRQEIDETERALDDNSLCREERQELQTKLYSLESAFRYESETIRKLPYVCRFKDTNNLEFYLDQWKLYAKDAKQDTVRSIAYATWRRSANSDIREDDILPDNWRWSYTWKRA